MVPALYGLSLSQASPSPNAPFPVFVSPSPVSVAPGAGSHVLHAPATDGHAPAPDVRVQQFLAAFKGKKKKHSSSLLRLEIKHTRASEF